MGDVITTSMGPEANERERLGEYDFSLLFQQFLRGKNATDDFRQTVALAIARQCLRPHLTDPVAIAAFDAGQAFARGEIDKKALFAARRALTRRIDELKPNPTPPYSPSGFTRTAYFTTIFPIKSSEFQSMVSMTINALAHKEHENNPTVQWEECNRRACVTQNQAMAEIMLAMLPRDSQALWKRQQARRYRFHDYRFHKSHLEDRLVWLESNKASSEELETTREILDAFQACQGVKRIERQLIHPIVEATSSRLARVRKLAFEILVDLAPYSKAVRESLLLVLEARSAEVRFEAISIFGFYVRPNPRSFVLTFFEKALNDRSSKVRLFASEGCRNYRSVELLPQLTRCAANERNDRARNSIKRNLDLIRDGFTVEESSNRDEVHITVLLASGTSSESIARETFATMTRADLKKLVARIRREDDS